MKRLRRFEVALLTLATVVSVAGCGVLPETLKPNTSTTKSCAAHSAETRAPKHPIVELAWCIAARDDLYDPDHLFHETLGIRNYYTSPEPVPWGIQVRADGEEIRHLPAGIRGFSFQRQNPEKPHEPGLGYLSFNVDPQNSCVRMEDIFATFGEDYRLSQVPISIPASPAPTAPPTSQQPRVNPYGISYRQAHFFRARQSGSVNFDFSYKECLQHIDVQRNLDFIAHGRQQGGKK